MTAELARIKSKNTSTLKEKLFFHKKPKSKISWSDFNAQ
jgi:hypothetical protein